ncbi:UNVERIFIED_CONTAM: hypothetical protein Cloal_1466 [Acetivibrio alkalicellulosi]
MIIAKCNKKIGFYYSLLKEISDLRKTMENELHLMREREEIKPKTQEHIKTELDQTIDYWDRDLLLSQLEEKLEKN